MKLTQAIRTTIHTDKVLIPSRRTRLLGYASLVPFATLAIVFCLTEKVPFIIVALACMLVPLWIQVRATEKYVLKHDPMRSKEDK